MASALMIVTCTMNWYKVIPLVLKYTVLSTELQNAGKRLFPAAFSA